MTSRVEAPVVSRHAPVLPYDPRLSLRHDLRPDQGRAVIRLRLCRRQSFGPGLARFFRAVWHPARKHAIMVSMDRLDAVRAVLDRHKVHSWVDADAISLDNEPAMTVIDFDRTDDAARVQAILDQAG
jgi:hypothetical protein